MEERVLDFFKTFIDVNRIRLAALLAQETLTIEEIASRLRLKVNDVIRHLNLIEKNGLLRKDAGHYSLDVKAF